VKEKALFPDTMCICVRVGWLYDTFGEYSSSFYLSGASLVASSLLMLLPWKQQKPMTSHLATVAVIEVA